MVKEPYEIKRRYELTEAWRGVASPVGRVLWYLQGRVRERHSPERAHLCIWRRIQGYIPMWILFKWRYLRRKEG